MKFTKLHIHNFSTIGEARLELNDRGLLLIQGVNEDDPSAQSNGAGKSSIVDALCWAGYGTTARGISGDAVVNKTAKKDCLVEACFQDDPADDFHYVVKRHRKHSTHKNQLFVHKVTPTGTIDLSKGTEKETQELLTALIGCSLEVFMAAVYMGQEQMTDLPGMTDKMLKTLLEEAAGVEVLTQAYAIARDRHAKAKANADALRATLGLAQDNKASIEADLERVDKELAAFEVGRRDRAKAELGKALPMTTQIKDLRGEAAKIDVAALTARAADIKAALDAHASEVAKRDEIRSRHTAAQRAVTAAAANAQHAKRAIERAEHELAHVDAAVGTPCGECGKVYQAEDMAGARETRKAAVDRAKAEALPVAAALREARGVEARIGKELTDFEAGMSDVTALLAENTTVQNDLRTHESYLRQAALLEKDIEAVKAAASAKLTEANPWQSAVNAKKQELQRATDSIDGLQPRLEAADGEAEMLGDAVKVFGPAGVRAHILDTVTPFLNDRTRDYLGALADGNIHAVWSTLSKTAKGELREKFNIEVTNDKGAESFAGMSGGEKRKARLATSLALQDLVASRATKPIDLWIGDEIDHALDDAGLERLMGVLERKARERGTVLVISHNALNEWCSEVITVTKNGGKASVSGAVAHAL